MTSPAKFVELHILQSFVPSNLNRDDNNYPKTSDFGGVRRARISSQCIKRAVRHSAAFQERFKDQLGQRTQWLAYMLTQALEGPDKPLAEARAVALAFAKAYAGKMNKKSPEETAVLIFLSPGERRLFADKLRANWPAVLQEAQAAPAAEAEGETEEDTSNKKKRGKKGEGSSVLKALVDELLDTNEIKKRQTDAPDIALFGRMLAEHPATNIEAACQVAHAFSTHAIEMEYDYFTAMDDVSPEAGAGMIESTSFNSACYYRYALLDWNKLKENLVGEANLAKVTVDAFLQACAETVPTGMRNRFAHNNHPDFGLAVVRSGGPGWSLANAFEKPIVARQAGYVEPSVVALDRYWQQLYEAYEGEGVRAVKFFALRPELRELAQHLNTEANHVGSLPKWRAAVLAELE